MPKFSLSYAYDVPHYADFIVEADSKEEALVLAEKALEEGAFSHVEGQPCYDSCTGDRVFVQGDEPVSEDDCDDPSLEELLQQQT